MLQPTIYIAFDIVFNYIQTDCHYYILKKNWEKRILYMHNHKFIDYDSYYIGYSLYFRCIFALYKRVLNFF